MGLSDDRIERRTQEIGREIFARLDGGPNVLQTQWWDDWVMDWTMADERLKIELFRFVDVLPMLDTPEALLDHLQGSFRDAGASAPPLLRWGLALAQPGSVAGRLVARAIRYHTTRLARRFIAGQGASEVFNAVSKLRDKGMAFTLDLLGEAVVSEREADDYQRAYLELLRDLPWQVASWRPNDRLDRDDVGPLPIVNVSLKLSALASQFDPIDPLGSLASAGRRLREVFRAARSQDAFVNLDMEQYLFKDLTLRILTTVLMEREFRDWRHVGVVIQAYLPEAERDLADLVEWAKLRGTPLWVRLVKGAYWDYETLIARQRHWPIPLFTQKWQSDACFERCAALLLEHRRWLRPAIASHNVRSVAHALALAESFDLPPGAVEFQMLHGMGDPLKSALVERGHRLRVYTPFGPLLPGMAYLVRRLLENTSNTSFLRQSVHKNTPVDELLKRPAPPLEREEVIPMTNDTRETLAPFANEPTRDFSRAIERERMVQAISALTARLPIVVDPWINGALARAPRRQPRVNPAQRGQIVGDIGLASIEQADEACAAAARAFPRWRKEPLGRRAAALFETARLLRLKRNEFSAAMILECGKSWREADAEVAEAIDFCEFYGRAAFAMATPRRRDIPGEENSYTHRPRGVTVVISPWNFPLAILCGMTMGPWVMGNTVIIKPAEQSSVVAGLFMEILQSLDLPPGVIQLLPGVGEEVGARLVSDPRVAVINFTGSLDVGMMIQKSAVQPWPGQSHLKRVVAEMGGKNAIVVDDDADLDEAVKGIAASAFGYQGQKCSACSRLITLPRIHEALVNRLVAATASLTLGPPSDPGNALGPVIDEESYDRLWNAIERGQKVGTLLDTGAHAGLPSDGFFVPPRLFADVAPDSFLAQQELFGPILSILEARDFSHAIELANGVPYALTGGLFSRNPRRIEHVREELEAGNIYINRKITGAEVDRQPFGGFKLSGIGAKAGGPDYLGQFVTWVTTTENTFRRGFAPDISHDGDQQRT